MDVVFLSPAYPPEMQQFTRGLAEVGARVLGVGDSDPAGFSASLRASLHDYLRVPSMLDEEGTRRLVLQWLRGRNVDRVEGNWEPVTLLAARLRVDIGAPGMSLDTVAGFRDKPLMRERVGAAGLRIPKTARVRSSAEVWAMAQQIGFPMILKPVAGAGSADTFKVPSAASLDWVLSKLGHLDEASCEEFIEGEEFTYETLCVDGVPVYESVCVYLPNVLEARKNEWISPIILSIRDMDDERIRGGITLGRDVIQALGMGTGFTHMEWYRKDNGEAVFGEIACRAPGANMVDVMNYTSDVDLYREWARVVCWGAFEAPRERRYNVGITFKRAVGEGTISRIVGVPEFQRRFGPHIARIDLLQPGSRRRDWQQTFLSDGNIVVRHEDFATARSMALAAATDVTLYAR